VTGGRDSGQVDDFPSESRIPNPESRPTYWDALIDATERLEDASESPQLDAELLLREVLGIERVELFLRYHDPLPAAQREAFERLVARRLAGEPMAYIRGRQWFRTIELLVDRRVLVPRPETERLVEYAICWLARHPGPRRVIDAGTGSGAIALALATELGATRPDVQIAGSDISRVALQVAALNRARLGLRERVDLVVSDLLAAFGQPFDVILANLPYLAPGQAHPSTRLEPAVALLGGPDGFDLHRRLLAQATTLLAPDGLLVGEIDPGQEWLGLSAARELLGRDARVDHDYAGDARYLVVGDNAPIP
jgi:release factor glutamine methyltransferase